MPNTPGIGGRNPKHLNLGLCFSNFMCPLTPESDESPPISPTATSSHDINHNRPSSTATSSSVMIKNFNSLYEHTLTYDRFLCSSSLSTNPLEPEPAPEPADFAAIFASQRFFFSSPGTSNSLTEDTSGHTTTECTQPSSTDGKKKKKKKLVFNGSVAVPTYSPDPYRDFRRSMQEMVEARPELMMDVNSNWDILHELLLCYLALNPKSTHKFILGAFSDLLVTLMSFSSPPVVVDVRRI